MKLLFFVWLLNLLQLKTFRLFGSYALLSGVCRDFVFDIVNIIRGRRSTNCRSNVDRSRVFFSIPKRTDRYRISASLVCILHGWLFVRSYNKLVVKLPNHLSPDTFFQMISWFAQRQLYGDNRTWKLPPVL